MAQIQMTDMLREAARLYNEMCIELRQLGAELKVEARAHAAKPSIDGRDFYPMLMMMGIEGETPEARKAEMRQALEEITQAFLDPDQSKRKPYLDRMYDLRDKFRPDMADMNDPADAWQMINYVALSQTFNVKHAENPDYIAQRYPDEKGKFLDEAAGGQELGTAYMVLSALRKEQLIIEPGPTLPGIIRSRESHTQALFEHMLNKMQQARDAQTTGVLPTELVLTCPDDLMPLVGKPYQQGLNMAEEQADALQSYFHICIDSGLMTPDSMGTAALKEAAMSPIDALFIDGIPMREFTKRSNSNVANIGERQYTMASLAMLGQKHRMEMVYTSLDENGQLQMEPKAVRVQFTPEQEQRHMQQNYSWFRRTFFNWGPFRIKTLQEQADALWVDPDGEERHAQMCTRLKETFDTKRQRIQEEKAARAVRDARNRKELEKLREMEAVLTSARDVEKDGSVLSMLSGQMKTYKQIQMDLMRKDPLQLLSTAMAKHVLFWQLRQERQMQADGGIGPMEKALLDDGKEETIRANIDAAVNGIKEDTLFLNMLFEKFAWNFTGTERDLNYESFGRAMGDGGSERFTLEYMQRLKANAEGKEFETPGNEPEVKLDDPKLNF